jgi:hypothetical protein
LPERQHIAISNWQSLKLIFLVLYLYLKLTILVMKSVRIASSIKHIEEADYNVTLFRIQEILSEHRTMLITGILTDLPTYLQFKFRTKVDKGMLGVLRDKLLDLSNSKVNLDRYNQIVHEIKKNSNYRVPSAEFFREIDGLLESVLNPTQLTLVK